MPTKYPQEPHIWCPQCRWRPQATDRWICTPGCGASWNTFWTRGLCPVCTHQWEVTQCIACQAVSPHRDWYHWPQPGDAARDSQENVSTTPGS
jgi:hypothetical protein